MKTLNTTCCFQFEKKGIKISVVDVTSKKTILQKSFACDFEVLDKAGAIINPSRIASFIQKSANELGIPKKAKVSLGLEYISLSRLFLPPVTGPDFNKIVIDEAKRESPFSFTNENISVAYQVIGEKTDESDVAGLEVMAFTTPQEIIDGIVEVFRNTDLVLEAIAPSLLGLEQYLLQQLGDLSQPFVLIYVTPGDAEFYIWENRFATAVHYIYSGAKEPDGLQKEITTSLEHFNNDSNGKFISQIVLVGEECEIQFENRYSLEFLAGDEWSALSGLASLTKVSDNLNFLSETPDAGTKTHGFNKLWLLIVGSIVMLNLPLGWNWWSYEQQLAKLKKENLKLEEALTTQISRLNKKNQVATDYKIYILLENIRQIVSNDLMFDGLVLDIIGKTMQLEGFCLGQNTINNFIQDLLTIKVVRSVEGIEVVEQSRWNSKGYAFRFQVYLKDF